MLSTSDGQEVRHAPRQTRDVCCRHKPTRVATACPTFTLGTRVGVRCLVAEAGQSEAASSARPRDSARRRNWCLHRCAPRRAQKQLSESSGDWAWRDASPMYVYAFQRRINSFQHSGYALSAAPGPKDMLVRLARAPRASQGGRACGRAGHSMLVWYRPLVLEKQSS